MFAFPTAYSLRPTACRSRRDRRAFTLTELLVVITIIAVLAALTTTGVMRAMSTARQTRIKVEVDQLDAALKAYKEKYGSYPPCNLNIDDTDPNVRDAARAAVRSHVARAFPRYSGDLAADLTAAGIDTNNFRPDQALVFWLRGFSADVTNPFVSADGMQIINGVTTTAAKTTPFFEFDAGRMNPPSGAIYPSYYPQGVKNLAPYVYFDGTFLNNHFASGTAAVWSPPPAMAAGDVYAYLTDTNNDNQATLGTDEFINRDSFQLIATGQDGKYSTPGTANLTLYPAGTMFDTMGNPRPPDPAYDDNLSNFCERARMGDARP